MPHADEGDLFCSSEQTKCTQPAEQSNNFNLQTVNKNECASQSNDVDQQFDESKAKSPPAEHIDQDNSPESNLVTSTYKEDEEISPQPTQSQYEQRDNDPSFGSDDRSESTVNDDSEVSYSQSEQTDNKSESTFVSPDASEETKVELTSDDFDPEDSDDVRERRNPKTRVEREMPHFEENNKPRNFSQNFQRNRHMRPQMPRQNHPYGAPDFSQSFMPQFRGIRRPMLPISQPEFLRGHTITMMRGPPNHMHRMPPGMQPHPQRMPGPGLLGPPHQRMQRPPFQSGPQMFGNNPGMPPHLF